MVLLYSGVQAQEAGIKDEGSETEEEEPKQGGTRGC